MVHHRDVAGPAAQIAGGASVAAADVDDPAPALFLQEGDGRPRTTQCAHVLHVEVADEGVLVDGINWADGIRRASGQRRAVDKDVQAAQPLGGLGYNPVHLLRIGGVHGDGNDRASRSFGDFLSGRLQVRHSARGDDHVAAFPRQLQGDGLADAPAGTSHECLLVRKSEVHSVTSFQLGKLD